jgi:hypothetical protein
VALVPTARDRFFVGQCKGDEGGCWVVRISLELGGGEAIAEQFSCPCHRSFDSVRRAEQRLEVSDWKEQRSRAIVVLASKIKTKHDDSLGRTFVQEMRGVCVPQPKLATGIDVGGGRPEAGENVFGARDAGSVRLAGNGQARFDARVRTLDAK